MTSLEREASSKILERPGNELRKIHTGLNLRDPLGPEVIRFLDIEALG